MPLAARAQLRVEITGVGSQQFPIAVAPFAVEGGAPQEIDAIVRADLARSGLFRIVDAGTQPIADTASPNLADWKTRGADALVTGSVRRLADGRYDVRFRLLDTVKQAPLDGLSYLTPSTDLRLTAHRIADRIYEKLTGERGVFATRIAYVVQTSRASWELHIADADGANPQAALRSREPIISPAWSPDGGRLAYVSFETGKPVVYVHTITTGERKAVANFRGSNSAPAWSPDGRTLAVTLTREGNSQVFLMNADGSNVRRITQTTGIDTEPVFSPDGQWIYFTSDRGGGPQIYKMPAAGGNAQRVTFNGDYNISPRLSPDGKLLAYVGRRSGRFQVMLLDLAGGQEIPVTDTTRDESPSFAPNGRLLLYATEAGGRGILASASVDGRVRTRLTGPSGDIREPTWGPFIK
jgi:TolB protein